MKKIIFFLFILLAIAEYFAWQVYKSSQKEEEIVAEVQESVQPSVPISTGTSLQQKEAVPSSTPNFSSSLPPSGMGGDSGSFPQPTTEVVNGRTERTIHMGVRQWAWDPSTITVKRGELVKLIAHNADVLHGLVIPDLGVMNIDIPPDGAVIEFVADKVGTFEFFCSYYCGDGHMEMRGKITVEQ